MATISVTANMSMDKSAAKKLITQIEKAKTDAISIDTSKAEGILEGLEKGKIEAAKSVLDILDDETIATRFDLDINLVRELRK